jgi:hypothetical protein
MMQSAVVVAGVVISGGEEWGWTTAVYALQVRFRVWGLREVLPCR